MNPQMQAGAEKPHAVCIPFPAQGHVTPMFHLARLLHSKGFHITFVNTDYNHNRLLSSQGPAALFASDDFNFTTIPDGLSPSSAQLNATQHLPSLCASTSTTCLSSLLRLIHRLNQNKPAVSCIVSSCIMTFSVDAAKQLGIPVLVLWTPSASGFMCYLHFKRLVQDGLIPLKDEGQLSDGYLDTPVPYLPEMKDVRLRDIPTFIRTTNPDDILLNFTINEIHRTTQGSAIIMNTFEELESTALKALRSMLTIPIYTAGPLFLLSKYNVPSTWPLSSLSLNLWKEDTTCLDWLDKNDRASVLFVNFGSVAVMSRDQLVEFAWGLANSKCEFLWVMRSDLVKEKKIKDESGDDMEEFVKETRDRGLIVGWCPQEKVLEHAAVGAFLTHNGWNSTLESLSGGVPMISWPFTAEQPTNCRFACKEWGVAMEIGSGGVERGEVEKVVREMMSGEKGREMREKAIK